MKLIILRHAEAVDISQAGGSDRRRQLTPRGEEQSRLAGRVIKLMGLIPATVWTSPYPRAKQTAEFATGQWVEKILVKTTDLLAPGADVDSIIEAVNRTALEPPLMLVGHNPDLEVLLGSLTAQSESARVDLGKGTIAVLETDGDLCRGGARLKGLWSSKQMKALIAG